MADIVNQITAKYRALPPQQQRSVMLGGSVAAAVLALFGINKKLDLFSDIKNLRVLLKYASELKEHFAKNDTYIDIWEDVVKKHPKNVFIVFEGKSYTYSEVDKGANRVAHWCQSRGIKKGSVVALLMENKAHFVMTWLGILKAAGSCALINTNLRSRPLAHSLSISKATSLIVGVELLDAVREIKAELKGWEFFPFKNIETIADKGSDLGPLLDEILPKFPDTQLPRKVRDGVGFGDPALLIYTSGTTGLPKAATVPHFRVWGAGAAFSYVFGVYPTDRIYTVMPLYHSAAGTIAVSMAVVNGATLIVRRKFSATHFFADCREHKVTVIQYIGELCRYLLAVPPSPDDNKGTIRIAIGNGLRIDIWEQFQTRFNIPEIGEFYGATEGNNVLFNHCTTAASRGACGRAGWLLSKATPTRCVRFNIETEELIRDKNGFCIPCKVGEVGELINECTPGDPSREFKGYHGNEKANASKIAENVFKKGDKYFRSGDLVKYENHHWYFVDRIGDTFRWKGENVSTTEVAEAISVFPGVSEVNVYGVEVPGVKDFGRACMAAIVCNDNLDFKGLAAHCQKMLPSYAMPLFLRKLPAISITGTFKHQKVELRAQGCNPTACVTGTEYDPVFVYDEKQKTFVRFTASDYQQMEAGAKTAPDTGKKRSKL